MTYEERKNNYERQNSKYESKTLQEALKKDLDCYPLKDSYARDVFLRMLLIDAIEGNYRGETYTHKYVEKKKVVKDEILKLIDGNVNENDDNYTIANKTSNKFLILYLENEKETESSYSDNAIENTVKKI